MAFVGELMFFVLFCFLHENSFVSKKEICFIFHVADSTDIIMTTCIQSTKSTLIVGMAAALT